jgi:hypothetical protein
MNFEKQIKEGPDEKKHKGNNKRQADKVVPPHYRSDFEMVPSHYRLDFDAENQKPNVYIYGICYIASFSGSHFCFAKNCVFTFRSVRKQNS